MVLREVGPGAHFLGCSHTQRNFESAFYVSKIADNNSFEQWQSEGALDASQRASKRVKEMLEAYEPPGIDPSVDAALLDYIERQKRAYPDANH